MRSAAMERTRSGVASRSRTARIPRAVVRPAGPRQTWSPLVDDRTRNYYETEARAVAEREWSIPPPLQRLFPISFPAGSRVLDLGSGAGSNLAELVREGYDAYGVEPSQALREITLLRAPSSAGKLFAGALPSEIPRVEQLGGPVQGVVCSAVLQHLPRAELFEAVFSIRALLEDRGRVLISVPQERADVRDSRDTYGRFFNGVTPDEFELLFERAGFVSIHRDHSRDALGRSHVSWTSMLFELRGGANARPIDLIESVLSRRERKVATYKFALIRALCAIALTEPHVVRFATDGKVRVPIDRIAERWIDYYWPIFESAQFLPQMNGERGAREHRLGFAKELRGLQGSYRAGGLTAFALDRRKGEMRDRAARMHGKLLAKLRNVIRSGPVTYAGGARGEQLFGYERGSVLVSAPLWRELSLMGHWIQDALILRWADLVQTLSKREVTIERVVERLLVSPDAEREQGDARSVYEAAGIGECVWTGRRITPASMEIDHVIPFSLWRNNDLWNLLPAAKAVNAEKSDRIPATGLLRRRRGAIVECWEAARTAFPSRFEREASAQVGTLATSRGLQLGELFERLVESAEVTALQRACERWEPRG